MSDESKFYAINGYTNIILKMGPIIKRS